MTLGHTQICSSVLSRSPFSIELLLILAGCFLYFPVSGMSGTKLSFVINNWSGCSIKDAFPRDERHPFCSGVHVHCIFWS